MQGFDVSLRNRNLPSLRFRRQESLARDMALRVVSTSICQKPLVVLGTLSSQHQSVFWRSNIIIHPTRLSKIFLRRSPLRAGDDGRYTVPAPGEIGTASCKLQYS